MNFGNFRRVYCDVTAELRGNKKKLQKWKSSWQVDLNRMQESKVSRALGLNIVTPRNVIDENLVLNFWSPLYTVFR